MFRKKQSVAAAAAQLRGGMQSPFGAGLPAVPPGEAQLYRAMRQSLPVLDAAIGKLVRLSGGFTVRSAQQQTALNEFLRAVCWGDVNALELREGKSPLEVVLCGCDEDGRMRPLPRQELLLFTALNPEPGSPYGVSLLRSMPFLADILLKIYRTIGKNWERAGNVRYAVVCRPGGDGMERGSASERAGAIAAEWSEAMRDSQSGVVRDFVAVGDVSVKVIGADGPVLDAAVPVRQLLEQLVAKTGLPPFLLGLSWSSTERMSAQQADLLTSELWALRRAVEPVLLRICTLWLRLHGCGCAPEIVWDDISLQDLVEEAQADLYRARTEQLRKGT